MESFHKLDYKCATQYVLHNSSTGVSTVLNLCHSYPQGYMEPFSHHSCVKNMDLTVTIFGNY